MKSIKYLNYSIIAIFIISFFTACDLEDASFSADADVIFSKKIIDNDTVYATDYYAYGSTSISSANVSSPSGVTMLMDSYSAGYTYASITDEDDYSTNYPTTGTYTFNLTGTDDETLELTDTQEFYNLGFTEIDSLSFYEYYNGFYLRWEPVTGAEKYIVLLYDSSGDLVFTSDEIDAETNNYNVVDSYYGEWVSSPVCGDTYTLEIQSIIYDISSSDLYYYYNIQEVSYSDFTITWE